MLRIGSLILSFLHFHVRADYLITRFITGQTISSRLTLLPSGIVVERSSLLRSFAADLPILNRFTLPLELATPLPLSPGQVSR